MITSARLGRNLFIGNFLFVYAGIRAIALRNAYEFKMPLGGMKKLQYFKVTPSIINDEDSKIPLSRYKDKSMEFQEAALHVSDNTSLRGYFGSEKYFHGYEDIIYDDLQFSNLIAARAKSILNKDVLNVDHLVSIHVRRGDYVTSGFANLADSHDYYNNSIDYMNAMLSGRILYVVVSNDIEWTKDYFKNRSEKFMFFSSTKNNLNDKMIINDLASMVYCDHNIIANSTFSWWGAWLGRYRDADGIVVRPSIWKRNDTGLEKYIEDIYPSWWTVMKC